MLLLLLLLLGRISKMSDLIASWYFAVSFYLLSSNLEWLTSPFILLKVDKISVNQVLSLIYSILLSSFKFWSHVIILYHHHHPYFNIHFSMLVTTYSPDDSTLRHIFLWPDANPRPVAKHHLYWTPILLPTTICFQMLPPGLLINKQLEYVLCREMETNDTMN